MDFVLLGGLTLGWLTVITILDRFRQPTYSLGGRCRLPMTKGLFGAFHKCAVDAVGPTWLQICTKRTPRSSMRRPRMQRRAKSDVVSLSMP